MSLVTQCALGGEGRGCSHEKFHGIAAEEFGVVKISKRHFIQLVILNMIYIDLMVSKIKFCEAHQLEQWTP